jgi:hypothetical protein
MNRIGLMGSMLAASLFVAAAAGAQPQSDGQQKCLLKINTEADKVHRAQGKENNRCVKEVGLQTLPAGPNPGETCLSADPKNKVGKFVAKVTAREAESCQGANVPDFSFTGAANMNAAATAAERGLMHDLYGNPVDTGLAICDTNPAECNCQRAGHQKAEKLFKTIGQVWVKCKQYALTIGQEPFPAGAASSAELQQCIDNAAISRSVAADVQQKIANRRTQILDKVTVKCPAGLLDDSFPGCGLNDLSSAQDATDCLVDLVECRFCEMVNDMDALSVNCGVFAGTTCPVTP